MDLAGACSHPRCLMFPVMLRKPFDMSLTEFACPKWQNSILTKCVQLSMPLLYLSVPCLFTIELNNSLGIMLVICEKSDNFTIGIGFCRYCKITPFRGSSNPYFFFIKIYFGRMWPESKFSAGPRVHFLQEMFPLVGMISLAV